MIVRLPNPLSAVVWIAFLAAPALGGGWFDRAFAAAVMVLACATLVAKPSPWEAREPSLKAFKLFLLLEAFMIVSTVYAAAFNGVEVGAWGAFELLRYVILGAFSVYLIRHYDGGVRAAAQWAMTAALYLALFYPAADPQGYAALLALCWLIFFSRLRLRWLHAAAAALVVFFSADGTAWTAALLVAAAALCVRLHRELVRRRVKSAVRWSVAAFVLLLAGAAVCYRLKGAAAPSPVASAQAAQFARRSPLFGWGASEEAAMLGRSQYLCWALKGGAFGAGLILAGFVLAGYRLLRSTWDDARRFVGALVFLSCVALMLSAGKFLESFRLCFVTAFFLAGMHGEGRS